MVVLSAYTYGADSVPKFLPDSAQKGGPSLYDWSGKAIELHSEIWNYMPLSGDKIKNGRQFLFVLPNLIQFYMTQIPGADPEIL